MARCGHDARRDRRRRRARLRGERICERGEGGAAAGDRGLRARAQLRARPGRPSRAARTRGRRPGRRLPRGLRAFEPSPEPGVARGAGRGTGRRDSGRDANRDGVGDTWYADPRLDVELDRPFQGHGVPPHYAAYDLLFLRWLARTAKHVDVLTDDDLERVHDGAQLARAYDLVVFSGHHEYVTTHEYDVTQAYRDHGGNLMFLSANNFFYRVVRTGSVLHRVGRWRDLGRPEAALVGVQYLDWNHDEFGNGAYVLRSSGWPFTGTGLQAGSSFGTYGIEIDAPTKDSPRGLRILATVPNLFGPGRSANMTYYTTPRGAKVFAAGTIHFGGTALRPPVPTILENVWDELAQPEEVG